MNNLNILFWFTQFWIWVSSLSSVVIMIPQVVNLHKNKYADNSSIWTYWIYMLCNLFWTTYQALFIIYANLDQDQHLTIGMYIILYIQLASDIFSTSVGIYLIIIKSYYLHKIKTNKELQRRYSNVKKIKANIEYLEKNIHYINKQFVDLYQFDKELCEKYIKVPKKTRLTKYDYFLKELRHDYKVEILIKLSKNLFKDMIKSKIINLYEKVDKLNDLFIVEYQKSYIDNFQKLVNDINNKQKDNFDLAKLSYTKKLRISFVIVYNLQSKN